MKISSPQGVNLKFFFDINNIQTSSGIFPSIYICHRYTHVFIKTSYTETDRMRKVTFRAHWDNAGTEMVI